jgi:hypothetical protein
VSKEFGGIWGRKIMLALTIAALLAGGDVLPEIDRAALDRQARIEARRSAPQAARPARPARPTLLIANRTAVMDLCRAAGSQRDPALFLAGLQNAFNLSPADVAALRDACRSSGAGGADARPEPRNPPGFSGQTMPRATRLSSVLGM